MKYSFLLLSIPVYILVACFSPEVEQINTEKAVIANPNTGEGFAVIELFTSQGCSSCPPADKLLSEWVNKAEKENLKVFPLAFHVDYWNKLGWKDPFSQEVFTKRQSAYADKMELSSIYTPQAVINGTSECVGSSSSKLSKLINESLSKKSSIEISIAMPSTTDGIINKIGYAISGDFNNCLLNVAVVERALVTKIKRGENGGKTLTNDNVVKQFKQLKAEKSGSINLELAPDLKNTSIVVYLQNKTSLEILAARSVRI